MKSYFRLQVFLSFVLSLTAILPLSLELQLHRSTVLNVASAALEVSSPTFENDYLIPQDFVFTQPPPRIIPAPSLVSPEVTEREERHSLISDASRAARSTPPESLDFYVHLPPDAARQQPLDVLLALHGMGSRGEVFAQRLIAEADQAGWALVAPALNYDSDYMDPARLLNDDLKLTRLLSDSLNGLPKKLGVKLNDRVFVYGFSRGAQLGHRFALLYPERVDSIATLSAGAYTMPAENSNSDKGVKALLFPFGIADLKQLIGHPIDWVAFKKISFWIGVGANDNRAEDVSRAFDATSGRNRIERAQAFERALKAMGMDADLVVFNNAGHEITPEMRASALLRLKENRQAHKPKR